MTKQRRNSMSLSLMWFLISRRSNGVTAGSAIRCHATVCHCFRSLILRLKGSSSVMLLARYLEGTASKLALIPKELLTANDVAGHRKVRCGT